MESLEFVRAILRYRNFDHLAKLLARAYIDFDESDSYGNYPVSSFTTAEIYVPIEEYEQLRSLSDDGNVHILQAILDIWPPRAHDMDIRGIKYRLNTESLAEGSDDRSSLLELIGQIQSTLISVSTNGAAIDSVNQEYKERYLLLTGHLQSCGLSNPVPYSDLWDWYGKWSSGDLPTYQSRREYIRGFLQPLERQLSESAFQHSTRPFQEPTGRALVDRKLGEVRNRLATASTEEQYQAVGLLCRETLISLGQMVFDPDQHPSTDDVIDVSGTDAKRMLERYLASTVNGRTNEDLRRCARASLDLANDLQHRSTATFRSAALCAEVTSSVVNIIAILSGARDPYREVIQDEARLSWIFHLPIDLTPPGQPKCPSSTSPTARSPSWTTLPSCAPSTKSALTSSPSTPLPSTRPLTSGHPPSPPTLC